MRVVTARVHLPAELRRIRQARLLPDRQRIHIGAQRDHSPLFSTVDSRGDARTGEPPVRDSERVEFPLDQRRRFVLFKTEFGVPMDCPPQLDDVTG